MSKKGKASTQTGGGGQKKKENRGRPKHRVIYRLRQKGKKRIKTEGLRGSGEFSAKAEWNGSDVGVKRQDRNRKASHRGQSITVETGAWEESRKDSSESLCKE